MSHSFRVTMGWGMPYAQFEQLTTLECEAHETFDVLDKTFRSADPVGFWIGEEYERAWYSTKWPRDTFRTANVLHSNHPERDGDEVVSGDPSELYRMIDISEDVVRNHLVFYPDCMHARQWHRADDPLDTALLYRWSEGGGLDTPCVNEPLVRYVTLGHGSWANSLMLEDGTPVEWPGFHRLTKTPGLVPRVPLEIRWYLKKLGIMDDAGINSLRPLVARWLAY